MIINVVLIFVLIAINGYFSGSEAAIVGANEIKVRNDAELGNKKAKLVLHYIENPTKFLSAIQVGITFIGFVNGFLAAESFSKPLFDLFNSRVPETVIKIVITLILTYLQVIFGELLPKNMALKNPEKFIYITIRPISLFKNITSPLVFLFTKSADFVSKIFGVSDAKDKMTEDDLKVLVFGSGDAIDDQEKEFFKKILEFDDQTVSDVMTHRTEMVAISIKESYTKLMEVIKNEQYSRIPVYEETIDDIIGIIYIKDLLTNNITAKNYDIRGLLKKPLFVPEIMKIDELFKEMQKTKSHIAIVIDEFGGTSGLVTMEDVLEELVGNIFDEHDDVIEEVKQIDENTYIIDGLANIDYVENIIHAGLPIEDYDTLSGFMLGMLGRLPNRSEKIEITYNNHIYKILSYQKKIIKSIKVTKIVEIEEEEN
ncbi:hemolysin family protein [Haploplasma modicum]|uniref:hemolysin family protein n=1 Tax=Haploplasma modicum TaxID=2150 RepID=UPI00068F2DD4|nr:hemolysin family protein [Haploplasma modicum]